MKVFVARYSVVVLLLAVFWSPSRTVAVGQTLPLAQPLLMALNIGTRPPESLLVPGAASDPADHGGQIEAKYDGFNFETIVALRKMKVGCGNSKGTASGMKGLCVSVAASLHSPGQQLEYVRYAKLRLVFETKDWYGPHPLGQRDLVAVVDNESIRLGTMQLAKHDMGSDRGVDVMEEVLEVSIPYATFAKIARGNAVELKVGTTEFGLKEKNLAALRDLNNRVKIRTSELRS